MLSNGTIESGSLSLPRYLVQPAGKTEGTPGVIMLHSFPFGPIDARHSASSFPELMDRLANELGFAAMCFTFRGCGESPGDFSLQGWVDDLRAAINYMIDQAQPTGLWLIGANTGGSVAMCVAAEDPRIRGCALLGPRADFDEWTRELRRYRPVAAAGEFAPRPLLLLHGEEDESVPASDTRQLAEAHGAAEMRVFDGGGHRLRHDPRAMAVLLGWLDRQRLTDD